MKISKGILYRTWLIIAALIIFLALSLGIARLATPLLGHYQQPISNWLSHELKVPVSIGKIEAGWYGLQPSVKIEELVILDRKSRKPVFSIDTAYIGLSLSKSILHQQLVLGHLLIDGAKLTVKYHEGHWNVSGIIEEYDTDDSIRITLRQVLGWFFAQRRLEVRNVDVNLIMPSGEQLPLKQFNAIFLQTKYQKYRIRGNVRLGEKNDEQVQFALNTNGEIDKPNKQRIRFFFAAKNVSLKPWVTYLNQHGLSLADGQLNNVKVQGRYKSGKIYQLQSQYDFIDVKSSVENTPIVNRLKGSLAYQVTNDVDWDLAIDMEKLQIAKQDWPTNWLSIRKTHDQQSQRGQYHLYLHYAKFAQVLAWMKSIPHGPFYHYLQKIDQLSGIANDIYIVIPDNFKESQRFSLGINFKDVSWKIAGLPEISNINGQVAADMDSGELMLTGENSQIFYPQLFAHPFNTKRLNSKLTWQYQADGWQFRSSHFLVEDDISKVVGSFNITLPNTGYPSIELLAGLQANAFSGADVLNRIPEKIMPSAVVKWLGQAIQSGKSLSSTLVLRGDLHQFPFHEHAGTFIVQSQFEGLNLSYMPGWPSARDLNGYLRFQEAGMEASIHQGNLSGARIVKAKVAIPELIAKPAQLSVSGFARGTMEQGLQYITTSPLKNNLGKMLQPIEPKGDLDMRLHLQLPLKSELKPEDMTIKGAIDLKNNQLLLKSWRTLILKKLTGKLYFDRVSISANQILGELWGNALNMDLNTLSDHLKLNFSTNIATNMLNDNLSLPAGNNLSGTAKIKGELKISSKQTNELTMTSDLKGFGSNLPNPLHKKPEDSLPSKFQMLFDNKAADMQLKIGNNVTGKMVFPFSKELPAVQGYLNFGGQKLSHQHPGLWMIGKLQDWHWHDWQAILMSFNWDIFKTQKTVTKLPFGLDFGVKNFELFGFDLPQTQVIMKPDAKGWAFNLNGINVTGQVKLPADIKHEAIVANLEKLIMMPKETFDTHANLQPKEFPNLHLIIKNAWLKDMPLGHFTLQVSKNLHGLAIDNLEFANPWVHFFSHGLWRLENGKSVTEFNGQLSSTNLSQLLGQWHMPRHLHGNKSKFSFNLVWPGTPADINIKNIKGMVKIQIKEGSFTGLSKETDKKIGLGNLVNILSFHSISKRLTLNFKDITQKGYHFDVLKGNFKLKDGDATTQKLRLMGAVADITIKGCIGLVNEDYDLQVVVTPHLTASLPVIATLAGGPIVGAVTWVLDKAVGQKVDRMTRYEYLVTGPWQNPEIQPVRSPMRRVVCNDLVTF